MPLPTLIRSRVLAVLMATSPVPEAPTAVAYLAALTAIPAADALSTTEASVVELAAPGYARIGPLNWADLPPTGSTVGVTNPGTVAFGPFTETGPADVVALALVSALTGPAALRYWWALQGPVSALNGRSLTLPPQTLTLSLTQ